MIVIVIVLVAAFAAAAFAGYNSLVTLSEGIENGQADIQTQLQRRADLIPNLVETVKGYATHESQTLQNVTEARAKVGTINLSVDSLDEASLQRYTQAQNQLSAALKSLLSVTEAYPDLKANENFMRFQDELAGTENRIQVARKDFNHAAQAYNTLIRRFPTNIFASFFGFKVKPYFQASEGADIAPTVKF